MHIAAFYRECLLVFQIRGILQLHIVAVKLIAFGIQDGIAVMRRVIVFIEPVAMPELLFNQRFRDAAQVFAGVLSGEIVRIGSAVALQAGIQHLVNGFVVQVALRKSHNACGGNDCAKKG